MKNKDKRRAGFTLVEMVIVVSILGVLSGVGFMKFGDIQAESKKNADYITAQNLAQATEIYMSKYPGVVQVNISDLVDDDLIANEPIPQSVEVDSFTIVINDSKITINAGVNNQLYPKLESEEQAD